MTDRAIDAAAEEIFFGWSGATTLGEVKAILAKHFGGGCSSRHFADLAAERDGLVLGVKSMNNRITELEAENERMKADIVAAAGECLVEIPKPGTDLAKMLIANRLLRARLATVEEAARRKLGCTSCDIDQSIRTGLCRKCAGDLGAALGGETPQP